MTPQELLEILAVSEKLKCYTRHSWTSNGRQESIADHSFQLAWMALLLTDEYPDLDMDRVIRMCLIHDLGEAMTGDIPAFSKSGADEATEEQMLTEWVNTFPEPAGTRIRSLLAEMREQQTGEAQLYKALDKMEAVIQHDRADLATWLPLEYELQFAYGREQVQCSQYTKALKQEVDKLTEQKIKEAERTNPSVRRYDAEETLQDKRMNQMSEEDLRQLEAANRKLNILMENMPGGVIIYEADSGRIREVSRSLLDMFGCSEEKFRDHYCNSFYLLIYKADRARVRDMMEQQMNFLPNVEISFRTRDLLGECKYMEYRGRVVTEPDGSRIVYAVLSDASERVLVQQELQRMNETLYVEMQRLKLLQEAVDDIPFDYNILRDEMEISLKRTKNNHVVIEGFRSEREYATLISEDTLEQALSVLEVITKEPKKGTLECRIHLTEDQPYVWYRIYFVSFRDHDGRMSRVVGCVKDISDEKKNEESLVNRLKIDPMTGILNKTSMQNVISEYLTLSRPTDLHALFMIDTDNFKAVNDNLGHMMGDEVIQIVARTVKETFRDSDYVGRVGGDEFMAFMKNTTPEATLNRARALNESMRRTFEKDGVSVSVSCSIGIAFYAKDGEDFETLYRNADARLYLAKRNGKNRFEYQ